MPEYKRKMGWVTWRKATLSLQGNKGGWAVCCIYWGGGGGGWSLNGTKEGVWRKKEKENDRGGGGGPSEWGSAYFKRCWKNPADKQRRKVRGSCEKAYPKEVTQKEPLKGIPGGGTKKGQLLKDSGAKRCLGGNRQRNVSGKNESGKG